MSEPVPIRRPWWHWPLLLLPTLEFVLVAFYATPIARLLGMNQPFAGLTVFVFNFPVAGLLCIAIGFSWARGRPAWLARGLLFSAAILALNGGILYIASR